MNFRSDYKPCSLKQSLLRLIQMDFRTFQSVLYTGSTWGELLKCRLRAPPAESLFRRTEVGPERGHLLTCIPVMLELLSGDHAVVSPSGRDRSGLVTESLWASAISLRTDGTADIQWGFLIPGHRPQPSAHTTSFSPQETVSR